MADISVVFNADTGRFVANVANAEKATIKAAEAVAAAKNKILDSLKAQNDAARVNGASFQELERINTKAAASLANVTDQNANKIIASLDRISERNKKVAAELQNLPKVAMPPKMPHGFSDQSASSAVVRFGEGTTSIRAVERVITMIPGATQAAQGLATVIGAAGLAGMFVDMGVKGYEAFQKVQRSATEARNAFQELHDRSAVTVDDLALQNQRIQDQIDKLSGHPNNGLATSLLEAKKMADSLLISLEADNKEFLQLLAQHNTGNFGTVLGAIGLGPAGVQRQTKELTADAGNLQGNVRLVNAQFGADLSDAKDLDARKAAAAKYTSVVHSTFQTQIDAYVTESNRLKEQERKSKEFAGVSYLAVDKDNSGKISNLDGRVAQLRKEQQIADLQAQVLAKNATLGQMREDKGDDAAARKGEEAARKAEEAARKANEQKLRAMEEALAELKLNGSVTAAAEFQYWAERRNAFAAGSQQYNQIVEKQAQLATEGARKFAEGINKARALLKKENTDEGSAAVARSVLEVNEAYQRSLQQMDRARDTNVDAGNEVAAIKARAAATEEETRINEAAGKTITRQDALRQLAILHAQQYSAQMDALNAKARQVANASYLNDDEKASQLRALNEQGANLEAQRSATMARDQSAMTSPDSSAAVGAKDALDELADAAKDSAGQLRSFIGEALGKFNSTAVDLMTRRHYRGDHTIRNAAGDLARSGTGYLLNKGEGMLAGALGFGSKAPKGTAGDPLHVVLASMPSVNIPGVPQSLSTLGLNSIGGNPSSNLSSLISALYPAGTTDQLATIGAGAATDLGSAAGGGLASIAANLPGFASGTAPLSEGTMAMIGEQGPELAYVPKGVGIVPNNKLSGLGGDTTHMHIAVDARGSNDPAMVRKMVHEGITQAAPHIVAASAHANAESRKRAPATRR